jgi:hypothetical protein
MAKTCKNINSIILDFIMLANATVFTLTGKKGSGTRTALIFLNNCNCLYIVVSLLYTKKAAALCRRRES